MGGDGSLHHTINAVLKSNLFDVKTVKLGLISCGTGNDWIKTHALSKSPENMVKIIAKGGFVSHDIGLIQNENLEHYFVNISGFGFNGYIINKMNSLKHLGAMAYYMGIGMGLLSYKNCRMNLFIDEEFIESKNLMVTVGICRYAGGGMLLCPNAIFNDGLFDITLAMDFNLFEIIFNVFSLKNGGFIHHKKVQTFRAKKVRIEPFKLTENIYCEADGEYIGRGKTEYSILPNKLNFYA